MGIHPTLHCPCQGRFLTPAFTYAAAPAGETAFDLQGRPYLRRYDHCTVCGHWFGRHDLDLDGLYARDYVDATYGGLAGMRQKFETIMALPPEKSDNVQRIARVRAFALRRGIDESVCPRLLDVGAGLGVFPAAMKTNGWRVTALETDARTVQHLRAVVGVETLDLPLAQMQESAAEPFDLIAFNKVLEHVADPVSLLIAAKALLLQQGFIYVEVPDVAAAAEGPEREEFFIEHHHVFSPASVALLSARAGLSPISIARLREPSGKFTLNAFLTVSSS
ncbi:MAG: class I SAM-dependent methyltransferase [Desulfobacteraceae bacterium]|nr:MAG: class I SAM-dependent methyltransferase [Desulfobacteraceae bacterium]